MRSVGTKLTLLIVVFPILSMIALSAGVLYLYHPSLEASVIVDIMATLSSVMLVDLLVWERLRDSLSKKLNYLHDNYLSELYDSFKRGSFLPFWTPSMERIKPDLKRYANFMGISLYPKDLLNLIDGFLICYEDFNKRWMKIISVGKEHCSTKFDAYLWSHVLGIKHLEISYLESYLGTPKFKLHEDKAQLVEKEHTKLIVEAKEYLKKAERIREKILERLEDFFKSNNLEFKPEIF